MSEPNTDDAIALAKQIVADAHTGEWAESQHILARALLAATEKAKARYIVEALAEVWASIDGKADAFRRERDNRIAPDNPAYTGHYDGYMMEAQEMIIHLRQRGFEVKETER